MLVLYLGKLKYSPNVVTSRASIVRSHFARFADPGTCGRVKPAFAGYSPHPAVWRRDPMGKTNPFEYTIDH